MSRITETDAASIAERLEGATAREVLEWATGKFGSKVALASSFGAEDVVLIDILAKPLILGGFTKKRTMLWTPSAKSIAFQ